MEDKKIVLTTGANKGIGFEASRQLANQGLKVILTSRNGEKGKAAVEELKKEELDVIYHQLDVTKRESIKRCYDFVVKEFGKVDVLVNNAGILIDPLIEDDEYDFGMKYDEKSGAFAVSEEVYKKTFDVNFFGPLRMMKVFLPLMMKNDYGRIVNLSSGLGQLSDMNGGFPAYRSSKTGINALTRIFSSETAGYNIKINSMCPGWVRTDMGGPNATRSPDVAAETVVWLATIPGDGPSGKFFRDKKEIEW